MKKRISIVVCFLIIIGMFCACRGGTYIEDFVDVQWICDDIGLQFTYTADNREMGIGTLDKDKESLDIVCLFSLSKNIEIYDKMEYNSKVGDEVCEALLVGHYELKDGIATITIIEDNLFGGDYLNKVIYLQMTPIN